MTDSLAEQYKAAFRNHPAGVAIITADDGAGPAGLTATSVISLSADPARLAFSLSSGSSATPRITAAETLVVHLLAADQVELAKWFATGGIDRFAGHTSWRHTCHGEPLLTDVDRWIRGQIIQQLPVAGATLVVVEVLDVETTDAPRPPLVYGNRSWYELAPTAVVA